MVNGYWFLKGCWGAASTSRSRVWSLHGNKRRLEKITCHALMVTPLPLLIPFGSPIREAEDLHGLVLYSAAPLFLEISIHGITSTGPCAASPIQSKQTWSPKWPQPHLQQVASLPSLDDQLLCCTPWPHHQVFDLVMFLLWFELYI